MLNQLIGENNYKIIAIAIIIAVILGLGTTVFFLLVNKEPYSSIYIIPNSIIHDSNDNSVLFVYGVKSSESGTMDYTLNIYQDTSLIKTKRFSLNKGEILDERDKILLPADIKYPSKISLKLSTKTSNEEVHFWLQE